MGAQAWRQSRAVRHSGVEMQSRIWGLQLVSMQMMDFKSCALSARTLSTCMPMLFSEYWLRGKGGEGGLEGVEIQAFLSRQRSDKGKPIQVQLAGRTSTTKLSMRTRKMKRRSSLVSLLQNSFTVASSFWMRDERVKRRRPNAFTQALHTDC